MKNILSWVRTREHEGQGTPHWWLGISYYDFDHDKRYHYIVPVNWIVKLSRAAWLQLRWGTARGTTKLEARLHKSISIKKFEWIEWGRYFERIQKQRDLADMYYYGIEQGALTAIAVIAKKLEKNDPVASLSLVDELILYEQEQKR